MDVQLVVAGGSKSGQVIPITGEKFLIGRADDCQLKPRSELISRYHCAIIAEDGYVAVRDLGSKNGVYCNGERIATEQELKNGDKLTVGPLEFFVHLTVEVKGQKKSKVESVSDAVTRTVVIQSGTPKPDEKESEIADWLRTGEDIDENQETRTIDASELMASLQQEQAKQEQAKAAADAASDSEKVKEGSSQEPGTGRFKKQDTASSRDAAANLLKNFFKGGR